MRAIKAKSVLSEGIQPWVMPVVFVMLFFGASSPSVHAQAQPDLTGIGTFDHNLSRKTIARIAPLVHGAGTRFVLSISRSGKPESCLYSPAQNGVSRKEGARLCAELVHYGRWNIPGWYAPFMRAGFITFAIRDSGDRIVRRPVMLAVAGKGVPVEMFSNDGVCTVYDPFLTPEDGERLCQQATASNVKFELNDAGAKVARVWVASDRPDEVIDVIAEPWVKDVGVSVQFASIQPTANEVLSRKQGTLVYELGEMDYPREALINQIEGSVKVLVGFDRLGSPKNCRPLVSSNSSYLGNVTCQKAMRRVRFLFEDSVPQFSDERYAVVSVNWALPE